MTLTVVSAEAGELRQVPALAVIHEWPRVSPLIRQALEGEGSYAEGDVALNCIGGATRLWLVEQGVPFKESFYPDGGSEPPTDDGLVYSGTENAYPFNEIARPAPRGHCTQAEGAAGGLLMRKLLGAVEAG